MARKKISEVEIGVTAFKVRSLELIEAVATGNLDRVVLTKRGRPIAELRPIEPIAREQSPSSFGALRGQATVSSDWDPTAPIAEGDWDAHRGTLVNE